MVDTVFSPSFGNRPTRLVGRQRLTQRLVDGLSSMPGSRDRAIVLLGQRGTGKTVLLWEVVDKARANGYVVAAPTVSEEGMLGRIVEKVQDDGERYVKSPGSKVVGGSLGAFGFTAGLQFSKEVQESKSDQYKLVKLCRKLTEMGHGVLIVVDEIRANLPEIRQLVITYQEMVGEGLDVALMMAGLPAAVSATLNDHVLTFLNRARKVELEPLELADVEAFFIESFARLGLRVSDEICREAAARTQGSPYLLQLIGHNVTVFAGSDGVVDERVLRRAVDAAQSDFENDVCKTTLAALSEKDVAFLTAMANAMVKDSHAEDSRATAGARMADVAGFMGVTPDYAQKYRKRLMDAGVIASPRRGEVAFAVPYLADYLRSPSWESRYVW